ncbi:cuticle protein 8-like [Procambarus clarkii]|uniref:cuticle protein 8-like n=1 Tax=Procambarus clarkii TaxID=6728 RepID=UPI003743FD25
MALKVLIIAMVVVVVVAEDLAPVYHTTPSYHTPEPYHQPVSYHQSAPYHQPAYPEVPPKYTYNYGVSDGYTGVNFGHSEVRDGYKTEGSYSVDLPDGRKQTVNYVDNGDGLEAQVTYKGEARHPEHRPSYPAHPSPYPAHPSPYPPPPSPPSEYV